MKFLIFLNFLLFFSCSKLPPRYWKNFENKKVSLNLQAGDIIIKERKFNLLGIFGHSAIMITDSKVLDYPKLGKSSYEIEIENWIEKNRKIIVLRYINMDIKFQQKLIENISYYSKKPYKISFNKKNTNGFYCSQFIWFVYVETAIELGHKLNIAKNRNVFVFPYDFINSRDFYIIN